MKCLARRLAHREISMSVNVDDNGGDDDGAGIIDIACVRHTWKLPQKEGNSI